MKLPRALPEGEGWDQLAHFAAGFGVVAVAHLLGAQVTPFAGAWIGFALGGVREVTEGGNVLSAGSRRDLIFWTLGGLAAGACFAN